MVTAPNSFRKKERAFAILRYISSIMVLGGYFILLNVDVTTGIYIRVAANLIVYPWLISARLYDGITVISIMTAIDIHKLFMLLH